jgi:hypothetical protein
MWSHLIFGRNTFYPLTGKEVFYGENARFYGLSSKHLWGGILIWVIILLLIFAVNGCVHLSYKLRQEKANNSPRRRQSRPSMHSDKQPENPDRIDKLRRQFRFNIYIRFLMFAYFDFVLISMLHIFDGEGEL